MKYLSNWRKRKQVSDSVSSDERTRRNPSLRHVRNKIGELLWKGRPKRVKVL